MDALLFLTRLAFGLQFDKVVLCVCDTLQNIMSSDLKRCRSTLWLVTALQKRPESTPSQKKKHSFWFRRDNTRHWRSPLGVWHQRVGIRGDDGLYHWDKGGVLHIGTSGLRGPLFEVVAGQLEGKWGLGIPWSPLGHIYHTGEVQEGRVLHGAQRYRRGLRTAPPLLFGPK